MMTPGDARIAGRAPAPDKGLHALQMEETTQRLARSLDLPAARTPLLGRADDLARLERLIAQPDIHLITLTGPGGVGKTRLAVAVAATVESAFPDGIIVVSLASVRDAAHVGDEIAAALGAREGVEGSVADTISAAIGQRQVLLVLDNLEHLLDAADLIGMLIRRCPGLTVLATSRVSLRLSGEHEYPVPPLAIEPDGDSDPAERLLDQPGVRLFAERARAVRPGFDATADNAEAIAEIVRRLDGLPLAIELAAARTKVMAPAALLSRLTHSLHMLSGGPRDVPARLQSMRDAIRWSYDLLEADLARFFRALGVFAGGFTLEAAEAVAGLAPGDGLDRLGALVDHSLVVTVETNADEPRFSLLETIREFAVEQLTELGERPEMERRHATLFAEEISRAADAFFTADETGAMDRLDRETADIRGALTWLMEHDLPRAAETIYDSWYFWGVRGHYREALDWLTRVEARLPELDPLTGARIEVALGFLNWATGQYDGARARFDGAIAVLEPAGKERDVAIARFGQGSVYRDRDEHDRAREALNQALAVFERLDERAWMGFTLSVLGASARELGRYDEALALLERGLAISRSISYPGGMTPIVDHLGDIARERGDYSAAMSYYRETMRLWLDLRDPHGGADSLGGFAAVLAQFGDDATAARLLGSVMATYHQLGFPPSRYGPAVRPGMLDDLRARLGAERFEAAWQRGEREPLFTAIQEALAYEPGKPAEPAPEPAPPAPWHEAYGLTAREREIIDLLIEGKSNAEIGEALFISPRTAGTHVGNIFAKLGVSSRAAAVALAMRGREATPPFTPSS